MWFEGDLGWIAFEMTDRRATHARSTVHPLFALITVPAADVFRALGAGAKGSVAGMIGLSAALWTASFYVLVRSLGTRRPDAAIMLLLATISAAGQFWLRRSRDGGTRIGERYGCGGGPASGPRSAHCASAG